MARLRWLPVAALALLAMPGSGPARPAQPTVAWCCSAPRLTGIANTGSLRLDVNGSPMDVHDGQIDHWGGAYYLYGTTYGCGFAWQSPSSKFCGFAVYSSPDLARWTPLGLLFDASAPTWQARCAFLGCFRPKVLQRPDGVYVLWFNVVGAAPWYAVMTSSSPAGPFVEQPMPDLHDSGVPFCMNGVDGDQSLYAEAGTAWIAYARCGQLVIEQLTPDYLSGSGALTVMRPPWQSIPGGMQPGQVGGVEAPILVKRGSTYFLLFSDPACPYCRTTGTAYETAPSPLGPWTFGGWASVDSCGGQPNDVLQLPDGTNVYQVDQWHGLDSPGGNTETTAAQYWGPLTFAWGTVQPIRCVSWWAVHP